MKETFFVKIYSQIISISRFDELYISCMSADKVESNKKSIDFEIEKFQVLNFLFFDEREKV